VIDAAVPIRLPSVMAAKIDPVIFQFYKSFACFSTSWLVLLYMVCILQVLCVCVCASGLHTTTIAKFACNSCGFSSSYVIFLHNGGFQVYDLVKFRN
jgi:hypothetical protein